MEGILGDPGADSGGEGKSERAEKYGTKKSKERREEPLGKMSYQTSSKRSPPFWLLIGARKRLCFSAQSEGRTGPPPPFKQALSLAILAIQFLEGFYIRDFKTNLKKALNFAIQAF